MTIIEASIALAVLAFLVLVTFLVIALFRVIRTLKQCDPLIKNANYLVSDLKEKSERLNILFRPLAHMGKKKGESKTTKNLDTVANVLNFATDGLLLFNKFRRKR